MNRSYGMVVGLDVGTHRIGVARGDLTVGIATPLSAIENNQNAIDKLGRIVKEETARIVVIGLPRNAQGEETLQSHFSRQFAERLVQELQIEVILQDESVTSLEAEQRLRQRKGFRESMLRDGTLDSEAAALILTDFLERATHAAA